jgi:pilus assembly protein CpaF
VVLNPNCNVIAVLGGKGGVGKSVFAANFATALMMELRTQVLLIDADAKSCGDQNVILGVQNPNKTLAEVASFGGSLNPQAIPQLITQHPSGLHYIAAVRGPQETLQVNTDSLMKQLEFLSRAYKYVVIDLGNDLQSLQHTLLQESTMAMIVTVPEVLVINQTQRLVQELLSATYPMDMFQLVINKATPAGLSPQVIAQSLRLQPIGAIPQDDVTTAASLQRATPFILSNNKAPISAAYYEIVRKMTGGILQKLKTLQKPQSPVAATTTNEAVSKSAVITEDVQDPRTLMKLRIHEELIRAMDLDKKGATDTKGNKAKELALRNKAQQVISQLVDKDSPGMARDERSKIIKEVLEEALGLGPLEDLLADPSVTEIMVNGYKKIFIEQAGKAKLSTTKFTSNLHLKNVIERIVTPLGRRIDESSPYVDARLQDGSRVNAVIEPLSIDGPSLTIRKFKKGGITSQQYIDYGSMNQQMVDFLNICVKNRLNIIVSGGTGSGKTTLLNFISSFIEARYRVVTIEDAAELQLQQEHVVRLETRPSNMEGKGAVTIRDLVRNALRMRPDIIIVGETRDGAAMDMLQAMNTGHDGSMTTTHANSPRECISRLETLCMMAGMELPMKAIREQIASSVQLIVQIRRLSDGSRKITHITEVCGMQGEAVTMNDIFVFKEIDRDKNNKVRGQFLPSGRMPTFFEEFVKRGVKIPTDLFSVGGSGDAKPATGTGVPTPMVNPLKKTGSGGR